MHQKSLLAIQYFVKSTSTSCSTLCLARVPEVPVLVLKIGTEVQLKSHYYQLQQDWLVMTT